MTKHQPFEVIGYHSCDRQIGLNVLNGETNLILSANTWDWLGPGIYFWEQDPIRALTYSIESATGAQFNKIRIKTPFVLGAIIELGNCLNLVESQSINILSTGFNSLRDTYKSAKRNLPKNNGANRSLDCAVIKLIHQTNQDKKKQAYQTVRNAFDEGGEAYPGASFTSRHHIQVCVTDPSMIKGFFLPRPLYDFNPYL